MTDDRARMHVAQALTRAVHPETIRHLQAALDELDGAPPDLAECPRCGRLGLAERVHGAGHDCEPSFE